MQNYDDTGLGAGFVLEEMKWYTKIKPNDKRPKEIAMELSWSSDIIMMLL